MPRVPLSNLLGIEKDPFAARLAQVVLWIGHKIAVDKHGLDESVLPLADLSGIVCADALHVDWPRCDTIVGNPPFIGSQNLRRSVGDDEVRWISDTFGIGVKDYCVYWFRRAHDHLEAGQRAGLVGTNSVAQNRARGVSLDYLVAGGGVITDAVSTQPWPGEAVHVSLVNWVKQPAHAPETIVLDGGPVEAISTSLTDAATPAVAVLAANRGRAFQGPIPGDEGFVIDRAEAVALLGRMEADYRRVVRPYLVGKDIASVPGAQPSRWIIDFAAMGLEEVERFPAAMEIVRERVKPRKDVNANKDIQARWWQFTRPRGEMRDAIRGLERYIAGTRVGKRLLLCWVGQGISASDATNVFAFDDDYAIGVLCSFIHERWAWAQSSTLKSDLRYTPTSVFATFAWPAVSDAHERRSRSAGPAVDRAARSPEH